MDLKLITAVVASAIAGALLLVWAVIQVWMHTGNAVVKDHLGKLLYCLDLAADKLETASSRAQVIMAIQQALAWKRWIIPGFAVGLAVDLLVWVIRKIGCPDLHQEVTDNAGGNTGSHSDAG